jgi:hypothetical protein
LGVSICFIKSSVKVSSKSSVYSIEDMVNQILRLLDKAKNSGQLIKHTYTDEFWETALEAIKLDRVFVFDIVIEKKPLFPNWKEKKKNKKVVEKAVYEDILHHF